MSLEQSPALYPQLFDPNAGPTALDAFSGPGQLERGIDVTARLGKRARPKIGALAMFLLTACSGSSEKTSELVIRGNLMRPLAWGVASGMVATAKELLDKERNVAEGIWEVTTNFTAGFWVGALTSDIIVNHEFRSIPLMAVESSAVVPLTDYIIKTTHLGSLVQKVLKTASEAVSFFTKKTVQSTATAVTEAPGRIVSTIQKSSEAQKAADHLNSQVTIANQLNGKFPKDRSWAVEELNKMGYSIKDGRWHKDGRKISEEKIIEKLKRGEA